MQKCMAINEMRNGCGSSIEAVLASNQKRRRDKIALIGDYLPRKCGIATFTRDLFSALTAESAGADCFVVAVNDTPEGYAYPPEVRFEIAEQDLGA
jgi:hypothetical protein